MANFQELLQSEVPVLIDFSAEWCGPCKTMAPILKEVKGMFGTLLNIIKVDIDKNPKAAAAYKVQSVPTLILVKKGEVKWRQSGVLPAATLRGIITGHI